jgi:hypothetical protein
VARSARPKSSIRKQEPFRMRTCGPRKARISTGR